MKEEPPEIYLKAILILIKATPDTPGWTRKVAL